MNQMAPKASSTAMRFGAGLVAMLAEVDDDASSVPDAEASIANWAGSFSTGIGTPMRIDNHERRADSMNREVRRQTLGCHIGHAGATLAGGFVENHGPRTYARVL
jgi:hypothetical protein